MSTTRSSSVTVSVVDDPRWAAVPAKDEAADGAFFFAVRTTGVYCYPSCGARTPNAANAELFDDRDTAVRSGYRPCKRCRSDLAPPAQRRADTVTRVCRFIETHESEPSLEAMARHAGLSPSHLHRTFKRVTGVTPKRFAATVKAARARAALEQGQSVTEAMVGAGYSSSSRFHLAARTAFGLLPQELGRGGGDGPLTFGSGHSSLGVVLVACTERGVCAVLLGEHLGELESDLRKRFPRRECVASDSALAGLIAQVVATIETPAAGLNLPLDIQGSAFQRRVWDALRTIPAGTTTDYAALAGALGKPGAARAVASACAANPVAIGVPCHRVLRGDGGLAGYRWGLDRKRALLRRERPNG